MSPPSPAERTRICDGTELLARQVSPDGRLTLRIHRTAENGKPLISLGFEEGAWHIHPSEADAARIMEAVVADEIVIVTTRWPGGEEASLLDSMEFEVDFKLIDETIEFRLWSGRTIEFDDLVDERVDHIRLSDLCRRNAKPEPGDNQSPA
jgi:hypothetical protein